MPFLTPTLDKVDYRFFAPGDCSRFQSAPCRGIYILYIMSYGTVSGFNLLEVAIHEIGHSLGLAHSENEEAIMTPFYSGSKSQLHSDDIAGIHQIYGK